MEPPLGLSIHVSYRRATSEIQRIQDHSMHHATLHSRLQRFAQDHLPFSGMKSTPFRFLMVDGTKVHLQGPFGQDLGQAEMRRALASQGPSTPFEPLGFWIDTDWLKSERISKSETITSTSRSSSQMEVPGSKKTSFDQAWIISHAGGTGKGISPASFTPMVPERRSNVPWFGS